ncbi:zinc transporter 1 [Phtheirospermum japonicum]|uniref:Zinc transporter 1 n=1 Tax=Phtheirospermum japonicum TaxID=374723 RepID=A0A830CAD5_9LAMI|nr:zinc transporter 1 [Phtheirospermum japonicum]
MILSSLILILILPPPISAADCGCHDEPSQHDRGEALKFKLAAIGSVLFAGGIGISIPILGRRFEILRPENDMFFMIKAFAAGVILATGFIHILPDAFRSLESPCLGENPWGKFPFSGFIAMMSAIGTLMVDTVATCYYKNTHFNKRVDAEDEEKGDEEDEHAGHGPVSVDETRASSELVRQRIISQVLELGIVVHSVIIGISLGASHSLDTIKPLLFALSFHQFFEGMGLGGCISQAKFESLTTTIMTLFFSLTTPVGIGVGIGISSVYKENGHIALIVEGVFNSASAGILIYMALVDLLAADFMNSRMESSVRLQLGSYASLLLGAGSMSFLAKWA